MEVRLWHCLLRHLTHGRLHAWTSVALKSLTLNTARDLLHRRLLDLALLVHVLYRANVVDVSSRHIRVYPRHIEGLLRRLAGHRLGLLHLFSWV